MRYLVLQPLMLHPGALLRLSAEQVARREFALEERAGRWLVTKPVGFKAGEEIETDDQLPKTVAHALRPTEEAAAQPAAAAPVPRRRTRSSNATRA